MSIKINRVISFLSFFIFFPVISHGQLINGEILDKENSNPIAFANILVKGTQIGTISNEDGKFELSLSKLDTNFTLIISVIGYQSAEIEFSKNNINSELIIKLEESAIALQEVLLTNLSAYDIYKKFLENYASNYYQGSSRYSAFYHSTLSENDEYKHLLEATVNIQEFNKKRHRAFEVEITQRRKSNNYIKERWGEKNNYLFDALASNPMLELSDFLDIKKQKLYDLKLLANTTYNDQLIYVVQFTPKSNTNAPLYKAVGHFNSDNFALIRAEYHFKNDDQKIKNQSLKDKTYNITFVSGSIQYQKVGNYYTQKYLSYTNGWTILNNASNDTIAKDILRDEIIFIETQYNYTKPISNPLTKWGDIYKKPFPYDLTYWNNQTKIPASQFFKKAVKDLEKHEPIEIQYFNNSSSNQLLQNFENTMKGKVDSILSVYHLTKLFNGVALITKNNKIIHHKTYGYQDIQNNILLDTTTVFDIGSITKQFTTSIILKLRNQGRLKLEDKIAKYLPSYKHANKINIHQLLAHRTGIPDVANLNNSKWLYTKLSTKEIVNSHCSGELEFVPGAKMEYSNSNFIILAAIIEKIENLDYYSVLDQLILKPLSLNTTYPPDFLPKNNVAKGYVLNNNNYILEPKWYKSNSKGSGGLHSTSTDLLKWLNAINFEGFLNEKDRILIQSPISYYEHYDSDFGYSWGINKGMFKTTKPTYFYGGTSLGFFSIILITPSSGTNIILINNKGYFPRIQLTNDILKIISSSK